MQLCIMIHSVKAIYLLVFLSHILQAYNNNYMLVDCVNFYVPIYSVVQLSSYPLLHIVVVFLSTRNVLLMYICTYDCKYIRIYVCSYI